MTNKVKAKKVKKIICVTASFAAAASLCSCSNEIDYVPFTGTSIKAEAENSPQETGSQTTVVTTVPDVTAAPKSEATTTTTATGQQQEQADPSSNEEYLENSLFIGDSLCSGLGTYVEGYTLGGNVLAYRDGRTVTMLSQTYELNGSELTLDDAFEQAAPEQVYFWLGTNEFSVYTESFGENYRMLIEEVTQSSEDVKIGIISLAPTGRNYSVSLETIDKFNQDLKELAEDMGSRVTYIDLNDVLADSEGYLMSSFDTGDGLHINKQGYEAISEKILSARL